MFTRNYRLLAYFVEVVNCGSVRGAARNLFVSAPVISKALADLEAEVNATLLRRGKSNLDLTAEGEQVYAHALTMTQAAVSALGSVGTAGETVSGRLEINLPTELAASWLPPLLKDFQCQHPDVSLEVFASDQTDPEFQQRHQVVIRSTYSESRPGPGDESCFSSIPLCVACTPELLGKKRETLASRLARLPFIGFSQSTVHDSLYAIELKSGKPRKFAINTTAMVNNAQVIREMVLQGYGTALLVESSVSSDLASGRLVRLDERYSFGCICQRMSFRDPYPSHAARAFRDLVMRQALNATVSV